MPISLANLLQTWPLWRQITAGMLGIMIALGLAVGEVNRYFERSYLAKEAREEAHTILDVLAASILEVVITEDIPQIESIINQAVSKETTIHRLMITNENDLALVNWRRNNQAPEEEFLYVQKEIILEGERFGHINIWVDMTQAYREIDYQINRMRWYLALLVALLAAASYLLIKQLVTHPLSRIENHIRHLFTGNLNQDLTIDSSRDLRLLTESINQHAAALRREKSHLQEVQTAREEAEAASQAKSRFLSTMSHELKTPIHGILGMAQLMQSEDQNPVQQKRLGLLSQSAKHLSDLVDDILDFADLTNGEISPRATAFNLKLVSMETLREHESSAREKSLQLNLDYRHNCEATLLGDVGLIRRILSILIGNAIKFTSNGHVTLHVACSDLTVDGLPLRIEVEDSGIGIAEADQAGLFNAFVQADNGLNRQYGGSGIGLAICRQLVRSLGGRIGVDSNPGKGSSFWVELTLPMASQARLTGSTEEVSSPLNTAKLQEMRALLGSEFQELIQTYLESLSQLDQALKTRDRGWDLLIKEVKSIAANIDAGLLENRLLKLEILARKGDPEAALRLLPETEQEIERVVQALTTLLERESSGTD